MRGSITRYKAEVNLKLEIRSQGDDILSKHFTLALFVSISPTVFN